MNKRFVQYGAGNIGRGFIGALFAKAGYAVNFIDIDDRVIGALNSEKRYTVEVVGNDGVVRETVGNVSGVNGMDINAAAAAIAEADHMATAVGVNVLPKAAPVIAEGLRKKWKEGDDRFFNIIICENLLNADKLLGEWIEGCLNDGERVLFRERVGLVEASIGRMVPVMSPEDRAKDPLLIRVEPYCELPVDKDAVKGALPDIDGLILASPFAFYIRRKLFIHNMGHATAAYLGYLNGCAYIWQAMENAEIRRATGRAMRESAEALSAAYGFGIQDIQTHIDDLLHRFANRALGDTAARVGADLFRKTGADDRLAGAANFCVSYGVMPEHICRGLAAAFYFNNGDDAGTYKFHEMVGREGIERVLKNHCGIEDEKIIGLITKYIGEYKPVKR